MEFYPLLGGFLRSAFFSMALLFAMLNFHVLRHGPATISTGFYFGLVAMVYIIPLTRTWSMWKKLKQHAFRETTRFTLRHNFVGAMLGTLLIVLASVFLLPIVW